MEECFKWPKPAPRVSEMLRISEVGVDNNSFSIFCIRHYLLRNSAAEVKDACTVLLCCPFPHLSYEQMQSTLDSRTFPFQSLMHVLTRSVLFQHCFHDLGTGSDLPSWSDALTPLTLPQPSSGSSSWSGARKSTSPSPIPVHSLPGET